MSQSWEGVVPWDRSRQAVALETSVLAHGLSRADANVAASRMSAAVRGEGAEPAWVWIEDGRIRIGASDAELERLMNGPTAKVARRDLPVAVARNTLGATTVSAMLWAARRAGIEVAATGGIGGVHPGLRDVSADLLELSTAGGALICSGPKSIIDPAATLERLEELGVVIVGYGCDRLPHFLVRETRFPLEYGADDPTEVAHIAQTLRELATPSTLVVCNPCPPEAAMDEAVVTAATEDCRRRAEAEGVSGKELTPYLLRCLGEQTNGASVRANLALLEANARLAGAVARSLSLSPG